MYHLYVDMTWWSCACNYDVAIMVVREKQNHNINSATESIVSQYFNGPKLCALCVCVCVRTRACTRVCFCVCEIIIVLYGQ